MTSDSFILFFLYICSVVQKTFDMSKCQSQRWIYFWPTSHSSVSFCSLPHPSTMATSPICALHTWFLSPKVPLHRRSNILLFKLHQERCSIIIFGVRGRYFTIAECSESIISSIQIPRTNIPFLLTSELVFINLQFETHNTFRRQNCIQPNAYQSCSGVFYQ